MDPVSAARRLPNHFHAAKKILGLAFALQRYRDKPSQKSLLHTNSEVIWSVRKCWCASTWAMASLFIGFLRGIRRNMPAEVARNMMKHAYISGMWQKCFWQITSTSMTNPIELSPTQVIVMIAQPRYMLMKLIALVSQLEQKPAVTRGSKPHLCWEKPKNPWMPMTFQGDRFCDEFSQEISNIFCVSSSIYFSKCLPDDFSLLILMMFFKSLLFTLWRREDSKATLNSGSCSPWVQRLVMMSLPSKIRFGWYNRSIARVGYRILHRKVLSSQPVPSVCPSHIDLHYLALAPSGSS